ncbi:MAG TPA: hypothetical protein VGO86_09975 [Candidatus Dormibacteraeota bacterium]
MVPPFADLTLAHEAPEGWRLLDLNRAFVERSLAPAHLRGVAAALEAAGSMRGALLVRAGLDLLEHGGALQRLRGAGAALTGWTRGSAIELSADDLFPAGGATLERSADAVVAAATGSAFTPELEAARPLVQGAERLVLWVERDQQLPAALALASMRPAGGHVELAGPYAWRHRRTLAGLPHLAGAGFRPDGCVHALVSGLPGEPGGARADTPLRWCEDARAGDGAPPAPWAGRAALAEAHRVAGPGCRTLVVDMVALRDGAVLGRDGTSVPVEALGRVREALGGGRLVADWWIGAPGVGRDGVERTLAGLDALPVDWVAALRLFTWPVERGEAAWGGAAVTLSAPAPDRDLARDRPFAAPGTLEVGELPGLLRELHAALGRRAELAPGRLAGAYTTEPEAAPAPGPLVALDPDCAVVELPARLDGGPGPSWYAANLREGAVIALDARLGPALAGLRRPQPPGAALAGLPAAQRERAAALLSSRGVTRSTS